MTDGVNALDCFRRSRIESLADVVLDAHRIYILERKHLDAG